LVAKSYDNGPYWQPKKTREPMAGSGRDGALRRPRRQAQRQATETRAETRILARAPPGASLRQHSVPTLQEARPGQPGSA